ncbi:hypothetical protein CHUUTOTORO_01200 [Serratia phage vB_SmaM-ChuuTotoro]|nr:hypothetical protein CHUUTOTORO_01200 [Serratia phage vB_SmaM-ChuuTotoro]
MEDKHGLFMYGDDKIVVYRQQGWLYMYWRHLPIEYSTRLAQTGPSVFEKKYKGSFEKWFDAVQKREKETMLSYQEQARTLLNQAEYIRKNNGF